MYMFWLAFVTLAGYQLSLSWISTGLSSFNLIAVLYVGHNNISVWLCISAIRFVQFWG